MKFRIIQRVAPIAVIIKNSLSKLKLSIPWRPKTLLNPMINGRKDMMRREEIAGE
jgi:hypothetical protein